MKNKNVETGSALYCIVLYYIVSTIYDVSHFNPQVGALTTPRPSPATKHPNII